MRLRRCCCVQPYAATTVPVHNWPALITGRGQLWPPGLLTAGVSTGGGAKGAQPGGESRAEAPKAGRGRLIYLVAPQRAGKERSDTRKGGCVLLIGQRCARRRDSGGAQGRCTPLTAEQRAGRRHGGGAQKHVRRRDVGGAQGSRRAGGLRGGGEFPWPPRQRAAGGAQPSRRRGVPRTISPSVPTTDGGAPSRLSFLLSDWARPKVTERRVRRGRRAGRPTERTEAPEGRAVSARAQAAR